MQHAPSRTAWLRAYRSARLSLLQFGYAPEGLELTALRCLKRRGYTDPLIERAHDRAWLRAMAKGGLVNYIPVGSVRSIAPLRRPAKRAVRVGAPSEFYARELEIERLLSAGGGR